MTSKTSKQHIETRGGIVCTYGKCGKIAITFYKLDGILQCRCKEHTIGQELD